LEGLTKVRTLVVDKTGTLTKGKLKVDRIFSFDSESEAEIIKLAAMAEFFSEHPVAKAVLEYAKQKKISFTEPKKFQEFSGKGASAEWDGEKIVCGKPDFLREQGVVLEEKEKEKIKAIEKEKAKSVLLVGYKNKLAGFITLADEIKPEVKETIAELKSMGVKDVIMLTGDNEKAAERVAKETGITAYHANLLPEDKTKFIKKYLGGKYKVAMVGDGVNDAASLALADVGIAMGAIGSDASIEAADIALMKDDFSKIPEVIKLGNFVHKISKQDFWLWGIVNVIGVSLVFSRLIGPEGAAAFNFITDFFPIINSLRLFKYKFR
jgi:Cd2+/Zn2+-exporting ATPase